MSSCGLRGRGREGRDGVGREHTPRGPRAASRAIARTVLGRTAAFAIATLFAVAARPGPVHAAAPVPEWRARYLAARAPATAAEAAARRDSLEALRPLLHGHPGFVYTLARAAMRTGDRAGALRGLDAYARMGLTVEVRQDSVFAPLFADAAFARIERRLAANAKPRARATLKWRLGERDLLAEDVAWDAPTRRWFVSAIHARKIVAIDAAGRDSEFVPRGGERPWGVFALGADAARRRLWAGVAATPEMDGGAGGDRGRAALVCFDLDRATPLARYAAPADGREHGFGDLAIGLEGAVYVTDSRDGGVYAVRPGADSLVTLLAPGALVSPQTPVLLATPAGPRLVIPDYARGLASLDPASGRLDWLATPDDLAAAGIDGLYAWRGGLVAIQNGTEPHRVLRLALDRDARAITGWTVLEQASPELGEPNHGVVVGDTLVLIGNSGWERMGDDGAMNTAAGARAPCLLTLPLR
jgi:hypothetical protein